MIFKLHRVQSCSHPMGSVRQWGEVANYNWYRRMVLRLAGLLKELANTSPQMLITFEKSCIILKESNKGEKQHLSKI